MKAGYYNITWNASDIPSGIYFYRLQAGGFVQTRKMVLLR
ncbi:MAG: T9SS type A sorting domain-containing protein [Candidatus Marinimicrobia bacterium]|nr:T9SS type A sorting domain-containing protein [Candidatus Neomarinimicrobiota bacterium]